MNNKNYLMEVAEKAKGNMDARLVEVYSTHSGMAKALLIAVGTGYITQEQFVEHSRELQYKLLEAVNYAIELAVS